MIIDKSIFSYIKKNAIAIIGSDGLLGNRIINILPGKDRSLPVMDGDKIKSINKVSTDDMLNTLDKTNKNAALLTSDLLKITNQINDGNGTVGILIKDSVLANDIKSTVSNLKQTSKGAKELMNKANQIVSELEQKNNLLGVLRDSMAASKIKNILVNIEQSSFKINTITQNLDKTILNIKDGVGAINYLSNDPKLVQKIDSTMTNINTASFLLNEDLKAIQHNFLFRMYFKKQEKEQLKTQKKEKKKSSTESDKKY
jgi:phospholipid/cholesterol/gamma-HCH transport system substrate-binding protein